MPTTRSSAHPMLSDLSRQRLAGVAGGRKFMKRNVKQTSVALSIVIAIRDAEETIGRDVRRIADHLREAGVSFEVLAVDDGCRDNSLAVLHLVSAQVPELRVCAGNAAGRAFIRGTAAARGDLVALLDSGKGGL